MKNATFIPVSCDELMAIAERELASLMAAVSEHFGIQQGRRSVERWLEELEQQRLVDRRVLRQLTVTAIAQINAGRAAHKLKPISTDDRRLRSSAFHST